MYSFLKSKVTYIDMIMHLLKKNHTFQETVYKPTLPMISFLSNPLATNHSIKRNKMTQPQVEELVYVHTIFGFFPGNPEIFSRRDNNVEHRWR